MSITIRISSLTKVYRNHGRRVFALSNLDLDVQSGTVFGLLGPNGAGKTTVIRAVAGLVRPSAGSCEVLGAPVPRSMQHVVDRIGVIVETPGFHPSLTGRQSLEYLARTRPMRCRSVDEALETVGLTGRADDRVKTYSLGMKQRLGVASVLLKDPELLVLDEPANGLDPHGISELRTLLRRLGDEGRTVFVSSHLLGEVEQLCDEVAIINEGRCVAQGRLANLLSVGHQARVRVHGSGRAARTLLESAGLPCVESTDGALLVRVEVEDAWWITKVLAEHGIFVTELDVARTTLEECYLELVTRSDDQASIGRWGR